MARERKGEEGRERKGEILYKYFGMVCVSLI